MPGYQRNQYGYNNNEVIGVDERVDRNAGMYNQVSREYEHESEEDPESELSQTGVYTNNQNSGSENNADDVIFREGLKDLFSSGLVDISNMCYWEVTSSKPGNELSLMRDDLSHTFWQSDGQQPHELLLKFNKAAKIAKISIFLNYKLDESYTPEKILIYAGNSDFSLTRVKMFEFHEPYGWIDLNFDDLSDNLNYLKTSILKVKFATNHQNGKDCHIRGLKIFSPSMEGTARKSEETTDFNGTEENIDFTSLKFKSESFIR